MTTKLKISLSQMPLEIGSEEEKSAFGQLRIEALGRLLTEGYDLSDKEKKIEYRPGPYVSAYHLAEWLIWNWWRLRWEPRSASQASGRHDWDLAHCMTTIGEGYSWPNIAISTDGYWTGIVSSRSSGNAESLFRYAGAGFTILPAAELEEAIDEFVPQIVHMADNAGIHHSNLYQLWNDLTIEREDSNMSRFRRFEALLGSDPDDLDPDEIEHRLSDAQILGERALDEIAIGSVSQGVALSGMLSAQEISEITRQVGFEIRPRDGVSVDTSGMSQWGSNAAWRVGVSAATAVRDQEMFGDGPLANEVLTDLAGATPSVLSDDRQSRGFSWVLKDGGFAHVALRSRGETSRRFDVARLLGDRLFSDSAYNDQEPLSPATRSYSYRQKAQRAFAAELLSPWPAVKEMLGSDYSEENQERIADHFQVSYRTINTLLLNNVDTRDEDRTLLQ